MREFYPGLLGFSVCMCASVEVMFKYCKRMHRCACAVEGVQVVGVFVLCVSAGGGVVANLDTQFLDKFVFL